LFSRAHMSNGTLGDDYFARCGWLESCIELL
jgi:hypothetical protein